jgi:hypothetical protein
MVQQRNKTSGSMLTQRLQTLGSRPRKGAAAILCAAAADGACHALRFASVRYDRHHRMLCDDGGGCR